MATPVPFLRVMLVMKEDAPCTQCFVKLCMRLTPTKGINYKHARYPGSTVKNKRKSVTCVPLSHHLLRTSGCRLKEARFRRIGASSLFPVPHVNSAEMSSDIQALIRVFARRISKETIPKIFCRQRCRTGPRNFRALYS